MLRTQSLFFAYNPGTEFRFPDIELDAGENLLVLGESGIGKTTLLHLMAGLLPPNAGKVDLNGTVLHELSVTQLDRFRGENIGLVYQRPHFIKALSLEENLALVQYLAGKSQDKKRRQEVTDSLGIGHKLREKPHNLSQGEQQRAAIALAVINRPQVILADEPTASLDNKNCTKVADLFQEQAAATGARLIIITHDERLKQQFQNTLTL
ncbi:MAG: ATP-binding cassette domain-containing protein [Bacteroidota bacterium]